MLSVSYSSYVYLPCVTFGGEIIICLDPALTANGLGFIEGNASSVDCQVDCRGVQVYVFGFSYEEAQLLDPTTPLVSSDITGVFCKGCLTTYIEDLISETVHLDTAGFYSVSLANVPVYADNAAALAGGLVAGNLYRTGADPDPIFVVH